MTNKNKPIGGNTSSMFIAKTHCIEDHVKIVDAGKLNVAYILKGEEIFVLGRALGPIIDNKVTIQRLGIEVIQNRYKNILFAILNSENIFIEDGYIGFKGNEHHTILIDFDLSSDKTTLD